ncbi:MAG: DedA family protein [Anaerolineales bacterium]|jgi:membrane protein DedA with SNARE-associated domain
MPIWLEHQIIEFLTQVFETMDWAGVVAIMALESANIPIPSEVTMPLSGWLLVQARGGTALDAVLLGALWGGVGCTLGSLTSYALGAWGGRPLLDRYGKYLMVSQHDLDVADRWFKRWGDWTAFLSRLLPIVRTFISFPLGITRVRLLPFTVNTFVGSALWCGALAYGGFVFGSRWEELRAIMRPFDIPIAIILMAGFIYYIIHHIRRGVRRTDQDTPVEASSTD